MTPILAYSIAGPGSLVDSIRRTSTWGTCFDYYPGVCSLTSAVGQVTAQQQMDPRLPIRLLVRVDPSQCVELPILCILGTLISVTGDLPPVDSDANNTFTLFDVDGVTSLGGGPRTTFDFYDFTYFQSNELSSDQHTLTVTVISVDSLQPRAFWFDYLSYVPVEQGAVSSRNYEPELAALPLPSSLFTSADASPTSQSTSTSTSGFLSSGSDQS